MSLLEMIAEWRRGCTIAGPLIDDALERSESERTSPAECVECTEGLINAMSAQLFIDDEERRALERSRDDWKIACISIALGSIAYAASMNWPA